MRTKAILLIALTFILSCSGSKSKYTITATLDDVSEGTVFLSKVIDSDLVKVDSAQVVDGSFTFAGEGSSPEIVYVSFSGEGNRFNFFVEPGTINITGNTEEPVFSGSPTQDLYQQFMGKVDAFNDDRRSLYEDYKAAEAEGNEEVMAEIDSYFENIDEQEKAFIIDWAAKNNTSVAAPFVLLRYSYLFDLNDLESVFATLDPSVKESDYTHRIGERIEVLKSVAIGQPAPEFTQNDTLDNPVSLSDFKGKYVLVDFWASWCSPCRAENPKVVEAFQTYNDRGFTVLGVSLDRDKEKWMKAIHVDRLTWTQLSDLKGWSNEASELYGVRSIPANFLINPEGIIIASGLRGDDLLAKLAEMLD